MDAALSALFAILRSARNDSEKVVGRPVSPALLFRGRLEVEDTLAVRAEMHLQMLLNLIVKLRWQAHPATLAGTALGLRHGHAGTAAKDYLVALEQRDVDILLHQ